MTYTLIPNIWYTITPETDCDIDTPNGISIHLPAGIQYFHFADSVSIDISGTATVTQNPPLFKPASASALGGGFIESNLRIGHGASAAVPAVCTLTLGNPTAEGTLMDNSTPVAAGASVTPLESYAAGTTYDMGIGDAPSVPALFMFSWTPGDAAAAQDFVDALNDLGNWEASPALETPLVHAVLDGDTGKVVLTLAEAGAAGNSLFVMVESANNSPIQETEDVSFSGGADRRALHLDAAPATYAHDFWPMTHPTAGGVLVVGDHTFAEVEEKAERAASISLALWSGYSTLGQFEFGVKYQGSGLYDFAWSDAPVEATPADLETALNTAANWSENGESMQAAPFVSTWDGTTERMTLTALAKSGEDGNNLTYYEYAMTPFEQPADPDFSGGQNARTLDEALELAVSTINGDAGSPIRAEIGEDSQGNKGIAVYALEAGSGHQYDCGQTTGSFFQISTFLMDDGQDARTLDEVAAAITAAGSDFADEVVVSHASGASTLTLTAATAGKAANAVVYTSTGCFGGETVKQGSTTRGKDAVSKTSWQIVLNGEVLDVEPAPTPEPLEEDTAMKNGGVYTVEADIDARTVTLAEHATASIIVSSKDGPIPNVQLPAWKWCTEDGLPAKLDYFRVSRLEVVDDGFYTSARLVSRYYTEREWLYTKMSSQTATTGDIVYVQEETHPFTNNAGFHWFNREGENTNANLTGVNNISLAGTEWTIAETRENGRYTFNRSATFKLAAPKKFSHMTCWASARYGSNPFFLLQAWDADAGEWVDAADVMKFKMIEGIGEVIVNVYPSTPRTDKWRILGLGDVNGVGVALTHTRFFETL